MKQLLFLVLLLGVIESSRAQSVGIGTNTPNPSAVLEIKSTNKGLLIPAMTTSQRLAIVSPANGLMVYDTDKNELYHYNSTNWRVMLNGEYWVRPITSRSRIGNSSDSVGIGTISPTEWLDVDGNIRSRNDMLSDGRVVATGTVTGSGLITSGGLTVSSNGLIGGSFTANGELSTNSALTINNAGATLQLTNGSNVNKGFFQLSGDDVRFGTNSGNTLGNVYVRMNGANCFKFEQNGRLTLLADNNNPTLNFAAFGVNKALLQVQGEDLTINAPGNKVRISNVLYVDDATNRVGVGTISPTERLHVSGNTVVSGNLNIGGNTHFGAGKVTHDVTGTNYNLLPVCYGMVNANGSIRSGTQNFTVSKPCDVNTGCYRISSSAFTNSSVILINVSIGGVPGAVPVVANYLYESPGNFWVYLQDSGDDRIDANFNFVVFNP